jgi:hypothetical protein
MKYTDDTDMARAHEQLVTIFQDKFEAKDRADILNNKLSKKEAKTIVYDIREEKINMAC